MNEKIKPILVELRDRLEAIYEARLNEMVLYGSQARGEATPDSDIDVLVVLEGPVNQGMEIERTGQIVADLSLVYDTIISCQYISVDHFKHGLAPILNNIYREGIRIQPVVLLPKQTGIKDEPADYLAEPSSSQPTPKNKGDEKTSDEKETTRANQRALLDKAADSLKAARLLESQSFYDFAVSRAYYTIFYVASALLLGEGFSFSKHSAVIARFGQHFAKTGRISAKFHRYLIQAQNSRTAGDYDFGTGLDHLEATAQISRAEEFLELGKTLIKPNPTLD